MSDIEKFNFDGMTDVRVVMIDGDPWFVAADVCKVLDIAKTRNAVAGLDDDEKGAFTMGTPGGDQQVSVINESGLYSLILRSRKPEAKRFKRWVTAEVLPTIRKTGGAYVQPGSQAEIDLTDPDTALDTIERVTSIARELQDKNRELESQLQEEAPKVKAYQSFLDAPDNELRDIRTVARLLKNEGFEISEKDFFTVLRDWGWIDSIGTGAKAYATNKGFMKNRPILLKGGRQKVQGMMTSTGINQSVYRLSNIA